MSSAKCKVAFYVLLTLVGCLSIARAQGDAVTRPAETAQVVDGRTLDEWIAIAREQVERDDAANRKASIEKITEFGAAAVPFLIELSGRSDNTLAAGEAQQALYKIGSPAAEGLVAAMGGEENPVFDDFGGMLIKIGQPAVPFLVEGLDSDDPYLRGRCAQVFMWSEFNVDRTLAIPSLIRATKDSHRHARHMAVIALGHTKSTDPEVHKALREATEDSDKSISASAVKSLAALPDAVDADHAGMPGAGEDKIQFLIESLADDTDTLKKLAAVEALFNLGPDAAPAIDALKRVAETPEPRGVSSNLRFNAVRTLGKIGAPAAKTLGQLVHNPDTRGPAISSLAALGQQGRDAAPDLAAELDRAIAAKAESQLIFDLLMALQAMGPRAEVALPILKKLKDNPEFGPQATATITAIERTPLIVEPHLWTPVRPQIEPVRLGRTDPSLAGRIRELLKLRVQWRAEGVSNLHTDRVTTFDTASILARLGDLDAAVATTQPLASSDSRDQLLMGPSVRVGLLANAALAKALSGDRAAAEKLWNAALPLTVGMQQWGGWFPPDAFRPLAMSHVRAGDLAGASQVLQGLRVNRQPENPSIPPTAPGRGEVMSEIATFLVDRGEIDEAMAAAGAIDEGSTRVRSMLYTGRGALSRNMTETALRAFDEAFTALRYVSTPMNEELQGVAAGRLLCDPDVDAVIERVARPSHTRQSHLLALMAYFHETDRHDASHKVTRLLLEEFEDAQPRTDVILRLLDMSNAVQDSSARQPFFDAVLEIARAESEFDEESDPRDVERAMTARMNGFVQIARHYVQQGETAKAGRLLDEADQLVDEVPGKLAFIRDRLKDDAARARAALIQRPQTQRPPATGRVAGTQRVDKSTTRPVVSSTRPATTARTPNIDGNTDFQRLMDERKQRELAIWRAQNAIRALDLGRAAALVAEAPVQTDPFGTPPVHTSLAILATKLDNVEIFRRAIASLGGVELIEARISAAEGILNRRPAAVAGLIAPAIETLDDADIERFEKANARLRIAVLQAYTGDEAGAKATLASIQAEVDTAAAQAPAPRPNNDPARKLRLDLVARALGRLGELDSALKWIERQPSHEREGYLTALIAGATDRASYSDYQPESKR